jgi:NAD(P)-dependent dehydrogenase (short-subunit alcohol dehydrogenase family)
MEKKVIVITGTSTGVGMHTAVQLAKAGHTVYATMRDLAKSQAILNLVNKAECAVQLETLDVENELSVKSCIQRIIDKEGRIDVLINNAGAGILRGLEQLSEQEVSKNLNINFMGVVRCIQAVLPQMRKQGGGQIITVSSVGGLVGQPLNEVYCAAKFAVEGLIESMATYLEPFFNIKLTLVEPGAISTDFAGTVLKDLEEVGGINVVYKPILESYINTWRKNSENSSKSIQSPTEVAEVIGKCVSGEISALRVRTSEAAELFCSFKTQADPNGLKQNKSIQKMLLNLE